MDILDVNKETVKETVNNIVEPYETYLYVLSEEALTDEELRKRFKEVLEQIEEVATLEESFIKAAQIALGVGVVCGVGTVIYKNKDNVRKKYKEWKHKRITKKNKKLEKKKETSVDNG